MPKLLVLGGSHSDVPLIESGLLRGLEVHTTGNRPDHPGHRLAHGYVPGDFSMPEQMLDVARRVGADYIVPGANDFAMLSASYVADRLGLPGHDSYDTTQLLHHKHRFKDFAASIDMPVCRHVRIETAGPQSPEAAVAELRYPLMIKPVDLTGGKGISRIDTPAQLPAALALARHLSRSTTVIAEEWFDGTLHSYSTVLQDGHIVFEYLDTELCLYQDYLVSTSISHCAIAEPALHALRSATSRMARELRLIDGVLHSQFLLRGDEVRILEYTRRMSGDLYSRVVQLVRGVRHADIFVDTALGASARVTAPALAPTRPFVARHCVTAQQPGRFESLSVSASIRPYVDTLSLAVPFATPVTGDGTSKVATVVLVFSTLFEMQQFATSCPQHFACGVQT